MKPLTAVAVKRILKDGGRNGMFYLKAVDDVLYVTESHWLAPLSLVPQVSELFAKANLTPAEGTFDATGAVISPLPTEPPNVEPLLKEEGERCDLTIRRIGKHPVLLRADDLGLLVLLACDCREVAVREDYLTLIAGPDWATKGELLHLHQAGDHRKPVRVSVDVETTATMANTYETKTYITAGLEALVMPVTL